MSDGTALLLKPDLARATIRSAPPRDAVQDRWPAPVRLLILAGGSVASWAVMLGLIAQI